MKNVIEHALRTWKVVEKITVPLTLGVLVWALTTILVLQERVTKLEDRTKESEAQWMLLKQHSEELKEQAVQVEVYKRMFAMLLDKNQIKTDQINLPGTTSVKPENAEDFKARTLQGLKFHPTGKKE